MLEKLPRKCRAQRQLLGRLVFIGGDTALRESGLWLWTWSKSAARALGGIRVGELFDQLELALKDPVWSKYTTWSRKNLENLRRFYDMYITQGGSKYVQYARVVNHLYLHSLSARGNRELVNALMYIVEQQTGSTMRPRITLEPWASWGIMIGKKICEKYPQNSRRRTSSDESPRKRVYDKQPSHVSPNRERLVRYTKI